MSRHKKDTVPTPLRRRSVNGFHRLRPLLGLVAVLAMVGFAAAPTPQTSPTAPTMGVDEFDHPLGHPVPLTVTSTSFTFMKTHADGTPVTYDPCRAIHYVTRAANQPAGGEQLIQAAVAAASRATGLVFIDDGATTEAPTPGGIYRPVFQPERYGNRWAPVLIAWGTSAEEPKFPDTDPPALGLGGSDSRSIGNSPQVYVSGIIDLNAAALTRQLTEPHGASFVQGVIEHELGHVVGLEHDTKGGQLMNWQPDGVTNDYQAGDLAGLAVLGQGKCEPRL